MYRNILTCMESFFDSPITFDETARWIGTSAFSLEKLVNGNFNFNLMHKLEVFFCLPVEILMSPYQLDKIQLMELQKNYYRFRIEFFNQLRKKKGIPPNQIIIDKDKDIYSYYSSGVGFAFKTYQTYRDFIESIKIRDDNWLKI